MLKKVMIMLLMICSLFLFGCGKEENNDSNKNNITYTNKFECIREYKLTKDQVFYATKEEPLNGEKGDAVNVTYTRSYDFDKNGDKLLKYYDITTYDYILDYDMDKTYKLLNKYIDSLKKDNSKSKILTVPFFIASDNIIISSLGPKIKFKYEIIDNVKGKIKTKVTDFGVNNALVEMYFELEIGYLVVIPMNKKESVLKTEILISSKIINGKVPTFYGKNIFKESSISTSN